MGKLDLTTLEIGAAERMTLERYGFDAARFAALRTELAAGAFPAARNAERDPVFPPSESDLTMLAAPDSAAARALAAQGLAAIERGEVAVVILNGGMATRFGGLVKGVVEVFAGKSFLALRLQDVANARGRVPVFLMNSFATDQGTRDHLAAQRYFGLPSDQAHVFTQRISIRLTPEGELFRDANGRVSLYAPGHGDLFECLAAAEGFQRFVAGGGKHLLVSNVDNIGASLSPLVLGTHIASGKPVTVEVAARTPGDTGGAPARVRNRVEVLEGFRFPPEFDFERLQVFNTNTMVLDVDAVRPDYTFSWFRADKKVEGRPAVQFERLMGQVTAFRDAGYLVVPREGADSRFLPIKTPDDLVRLRPVLQARCGYA